MLDQRETDLDRELKGEKRKKNLELKEGSENRQKEKGERRVEANPEKKMQRFPALGIHVAEGKSL